MGRITQQLFGPVSTIRAYKAADAIPIALSVSLPSRVLWPNRHWNCGETATDRAKLYDWHKFGPLNSPLTPQIGDLKTPHLNYGQTATDRATL